MDQFETVLKPDIQNVNSTLDYIDFSFLWFLSIEHDTVFLMSYAIFAMENPSINQSIKSLKLAVQLLLNVAALTRCYVRRVNVFTPYGFCKGWFESKCYEKRAAG